MDYGTYKPNRSGKRYYDLSIPRRPFGYAPSFGPARPPFEGENKTCRSPCVARQRLRWRRRSAKEPQALRSAQRVVVLSGLVATPEEPKAVGSNCGGRASTNTKGSLGSRGVSTLHEGDPYRRKNTI